MRLHENESHPVGTTADEGPLVLRGQGVITIASAGRCLYEVELETLVDSAHVLDEILRVKRRPWATPQVLVAFLDTLDGAFHKYFGAGLQDALCPWGVDRKVDWRRKGKRS